MLQRRPNDTASLLKACCEWVRRYVVLTDDQCRILAVWIMHTWAIDAAQCTPYLHITAPEKGCGKSTLLEALEPVVRQPRKTGGLSAAALLRLVDKEQPTLLLDEVDSAFGGNADCAEALRGVLNEGFKRGGSFCKCVGKNYELKEFSVFAPKALAGIGKIPETVASRSIAIEMRRKTSTETTQRCRFRDMRELAKPLAESLAAWANVETVGILEQARPYLSESLSDRQQDICEPLLAIAELAGGEWPESVAKSLLSVFGSTASEDASVGVRLLTSIRSIFLENGGAEDGRVSSTALAMALCSIEGEPWAEWSNGRGMNADRLAKALRKYDIRPRSMRLNGGSNLKGYESGSFADAWERYCPDGRSEGCEGDTAVTSSAGSGVYNFSMPSHIERALPPAAREKPHESDAVTAVTAVTPPDWQEKPRRFVEGVL